MIRAKQALEEKNLDLPVQIIHSENVKTIVGSEEYLLLFPKFLLDYESEKDIEILFVGYMTERRFNFLSLFDNAKIIQSNNGRDDQKKVKDEDYFIQMSRAKFVLCPNGDFVWTYRFFESIIFKAIPIVEQKSPVFEGFEFYTKESDLVYDEDIVNRNFEKIRKEMFLAD